MSHFDCTACPLGRKARCVGPEGPASKLFIIGRNPGADEDRIGRPFVGLAGKTLDRILELSGLDRHQIYITNLVKAYTENNREPAFSEIYSCTSVWLERELRAKPPFVVLALGLTVIRYFGEFKTVEAARERKIFKPLERQFYVVPTYHPSWVLRNGNKAEDLAKCAEDFARAKNSVKIISGRQ